MSLYRANHDYSNGRIQLRAGDVVDLDDQAAEHIERDSEGTLTALTPAEVGEIAAGLAEVAARTGVTVSADWRPAAAAPHVATGGGPVMSSANMPGLTR